MERRHWDVLSCSYLRNDGSGWVHLVAIQKEGEPDQTTILMEFEGPSKIEDPDGMRHALEYGMVTERFARRHESLHDAWDRPRIENDSVDFDWRTESYHGWWHPDLTESDLPNFRGVWSFAPESLETAGAEFYARKSMEYAISHPEDPGAEELMTGHLLLARTDLENAEAAAADARQRIDVAEAWFKHRYKVVR